MQKLLSDFEASGRSFTAVIELGPAADTVIKKAEETGADLIVVGKHGKSGWESMLLGSVARRVIQEAACDVLVVEQADTGTG
jgi:nucleotide-binding universal stress UspA family protein